MHPGHGPLVYDTDTLSRSTASQLVKLGGNKWFFITANYVFGQQLERDATEFVKQTGGEVLGSRRLSVPGNDRFLLLSDPGAIERRERDRLRLRRRRHGELREAVARIRPQPQAKLAALLAHPIDVLSIGLDLAQGLFLTEASTGI